MLYKIMLVTVLGAALLLAGCPAGDEETGGTDAGTTQDASAPAEDMGGE
jgi:hypothetical protein